MKVNPALNCPVQATQTATAAANVQRHTSHCHGQASAGQQANAQSASHHHSPYAHLFHGRHGGGQKAHCNDGSSKSSSSQSNGSSSGSSSGTPAIQTKLQQLDSGRQSVQTLINQAVASNGGANSAQANSAVRVAANNWADQVGTLAKQNFPEFDSVKADANAQGFSTESVLARLKAALDDTKSAAGNMQYRTGLIVPGQPYQDQSTAAIGQRLSDAMNRAQTEVGQLFFRGGVLPTPAPTPSPTPAPAPTPSWDTATIQNQLGQFDTSRTSVASQVNQITAAEAAGNTSAASTLTQQTRIFAQDLTQKVSDLAKKYFPNYDQVTMNSAATDQSTDAVLARLKASIDAANSAAGNLQYRTGLRVPGQPYQDQSTSAIAARLNTALEQMMTNLGDLFFRKGLMLP